jgi:hypothetical protein
LRVELPRQRVCAAIARNLHPDTRSIRYAQAVQGAALLGSRPRLRRLLEPGRGAGHARGRPERSARAGRRRRR